MKKIIPLSVGAATVMAAITSFQVSAHGWTDFPKARQMFCYEDGGYDWPTDGSGIPNAACRATFLESGTYPFVQKNEYAAIVMNHGDENAVKAVVPDGQLCYGADAKKSGIGVASADWQRTTLKAGETIQMKFLATAPHNPSYWEIYLSKPSYNAAYSRLGWDDVELIAEYGNIEKVRIGSDDFYLMDITMPAGRTGEATLFTRWQRTDGGGEGFYNCSDIKFEGDAPPPEWSELGSYVQQGLVADVGDHILYRIFNENGSEIVEEKLPITAQNQDIHAWSYELAQLINEQHKTITQVGIEQQSGVITYDQSDLYANKVYVTNPDYRYALDIRDGDVIEPAPVEVTGLKSEYTQGSDGKTLIDATVSSEGHYSINMNLLDSNGQQVTSATDTVDNGNIVLSVLTTQLGSFTVEVTAAAEGSTEHEVITAQSITIKESSGGGDYDFEYPEGIGSYVPGETVVLGRDGSTYECRPFPEGGWCNIDSAAHYEPGFGSAWQDAWIKQ
ncbi:lytic polysaccharide monooxygenase [Photobacterium makurazakiensis]|uniref:lytic polysaccharide monooxygenase n=1 Tax=Photobacterium makurazakiensis TaxID=2910234 RepID=UPI003D13228F